MPRNYNFHNALGRQKLSDSAKNYAYVVFVVRSKITSLIFANIFFCDCNFIVDFLFQEFLLFCQQFFGFSKFLDCFACCHHRLLLSAKHFPKETHFAGFVVAISSNKQIVAKRIFLFIFTTTQQIQLFQHENWLSDWFEINLTDPFEPFVKLSPSSKLWFIDSGFHVCTFSLCSTCLLFKNGVPIWKCNVLSFDRFEFVQSKIVHTSGTTHVEMSSNLIKHWPIVNSKH